MEEDLYDTNVLIEALKSRKKLNGYTTILNIVEFPRGLELGLTVITPTLEDYLLAIKISQAMVKKGTPVPAISAVVAAVAINRKLKLVARDKHFGWIKEEFEGLDLHSV
ncbi:PIN domain-containing protein [Thermococcus waiotapuensis]|uniref:PIN domain-containing protein n=1 Tax=Thermococcus waiotapuensis TaxID=90909 RepID=A0AAE4T1W8_9EURY|nr:PIN domain-containing protein [Thermococcus waiotapuensis]MDV3103537.1 PIN domain-containing protein [Thermococcus waiotapuensis]